MVCLGHWGVIWLGNTHESRDWSKETFGKKVSQLVGVKVSVPSGFRSTETTGTLPQWYFPGCLPLGACSLPISASDCYRLPDVLLSSLLFVMPRQVRNPERGEHLLIRSKQFSLD